jgi:RNA polymerase sigma factor (sigma-70 family)
MRFEQAFADLFAIAYRVAFRILGDRQAAEDVAQEAVTRANTRWRKVEAHAEPWTARVAANLALDQVRRGPAPVPDVPGERDPLVAERLDLQQALLALPKRQREVVSLRYGADLPEAQVAELLGCTTGTVKTHAHRGLAALRLALGDEEEGGGERVRAVR